MTERRRWIRFVPTLVGVAVVGSVCAGLVALISGFLGGEPSNKKLVQQISLIAPPPPPPPKVEPPPEPEVEEVKLEEPEPVPEDVPEAPSDEPPPGDLLGLDADGTGGADGFGLVGRKGGRSLLGGGGDPYSYYGNVVTQLIQEFLFERGDIRSKKYSVKVKLWLAPTGRIERVELMNSTGDPDVDESLQLALMEMKEIAEKPPEDLPQPVRVRITSRL